MKTMAKFEKETRHRLYVFIKKKTVDSAKCGTTARTHDAFCPPTHAWRVNCPFNCPIHSPSTSMTHHCPISAQIGLVITNHVREFHYGFDQYFHCFCFIPPWVPFIIPRKAFKGTCLHNDWIAKVRSSSFHRGKKGQSHWKIIFFCDMKTEIQDGQIALTPYKRIQFYIQLFSLLFSLRRQETQIAYARKRHSSINKFHTF